jgi:hypothetical protein
MSYGVNLPDLARLRCRMEEKSNMSDRYSLQPFHEFRESLSAETHDDVRARANVKAESGEAFEEMRSHLLKLYGGVEVAHSFLESGSKIVDCIPIEQQPSIRHSGQTVLPPPPQPPGVKTYPDPLDPTVPFRKAPPPQLHPDRYDSLGNQMWCPVGTIPMIRLTLAELANSKTLKDALRSASGGDPKRWAAAYQQIDHLGGSSYINVWGPQVFGVQNSASQQWFSTPLAPFMTYQSVECGWRVGTPSPPFDANPRLFIYFTPDDHVTNIYNLMGPGFVQQSGTAVLGAELTGVSQPGGDQFDYNMGFFLTGNAWWFSFNGQWIGYYPTSLFQGGGLATSAGSAGFGGETSGIGAFPAMGSGAFPLAGFQHAAYQRNIFVTPVGGAAQPANLLPGQQYPSCYNTVVSNNSPTTWGTFMYFGGPGGIGCP